MVASLNLADLNGRNGFILNGIAGGGFGNGDFLGHSVRRARDINGDGIDDLIVGAYGANANGKRAPGQSYVIFGSRTGFSPTFNLSSLNGSNGFALNGNAPGDYTGFSVSGAGDINGDGIADLIIGAEQASPGGRYRAGQTYVVFGVRSTSIQPLSNLGNTATALVNGSL